MQVYFAKKIDDNISEGERSMEKYKKMVRLNQERSKKSQDYAINTIKQMLNDDEQVMVSSLVQKTGMSRAYFYNNERVHDEVVRAQDIQARRSVVSPRKTILDKAMNREIEILKTKLFEKDEEIKRLEERVRTLEEESDAKLLSIIKKI